MSASHPGRLDYAGMIESKCAGLRSLAQRHYDEGSPLLQGLLKLAEAFEEEWLPELFS